MFTEGLHNSALQWVREVMLDTVGVELQVVNHTEKTLQLQEDGKVILTPVHGQEASSEILPINFSRLSKAVKKGDTIFVGHYLFTGSETTSVWLEVDEVKEEDVICVIKNTATLTGSLFTLHASQVHIDLPTLSDKDKEVDEVKEEDVICVIKNTATLTGSLFTLHASQVHIDLPTLSDKDKEVFLFQKAAVYKCNMAGKPAVVTRVVDSMTGNLRPTRTE